MAAFFSSKMKSLLTQHDDLRRTVFYPKTDVTHDVNVYPALRSVFDHDLHEQLPIIHDICMSRWGSLPAHITPIASGGTFHLLYKIEYDNQSFVIRLNRLSNYRVSWEFLIDAWVYPKLASVGLPGPSVITIDCSRSICPTDYEILTYVHGQQLSVFQDQETQYMSPVLLQAIGAYVAQVHSIALAGFGPLAIASLFNLTSVVDSISLRSDVVSSNARALSFRPLSRNLLSALEKRQIDEEERSQIKVWDDRVLVSEKTIASLSNLKSWRMHNQSPSGIHATWRDYIFLRLEEHIEICIRIGAITPTEAKEIQKIFITNRSIFECSTPVLLHGDLGNHNFLSQDSISISALIDWEDCMSGDPVFDIAFWGTFFRDHMLQGFLIGYRKHSELPEDFELRYWLYFLRIALSKTVHRFRFGYQNHPARPPASLRIQRALERIITLT